MSNSDSNISNTLENLKQFLNGENASDNLRILLDLINSSSNHKTSSSLQPSISKQPNHTSMPSTSLSEFEKNNNDISIEKIIKVKKMIESCSTKDDPRVNLLNSLKPYLSKKRADKIDSAIKILSFTAISSLLNQDEAQKGVN